MGSERFVTRKVLGWLMIGEAEDKLDGSTHWRARLECGHHEFTRIERGKSMPQTWGCELCGMDPAKGFPALHVGGE